MKKAWSSACFSFALLGFATSSFAQGGNPDSTGNSRWDESPVRLNSAPVEYPASAIADSATGLVWLEVEVDDKGNVIGSRVTQSSGRTDIDSAAMESIRQWLYKPATKNGKPVPSSIPQCFTFRLK